MLNINMDDVVRVLQSMQTQLIAIGVCLALAIIITIVAGKLKKKSSRHLLRGEAWIAFFAALIVLVNQILTGPMSTMLDLVSVTSYLSEETTAEATDLVSAITEEGVVLAENDGLLPLASGSKLNVFGWASTNPCYGGTGSGALNTAYPTVDILQGLNEAGIETNTELSQFYVNYKADRPGVMMWTQDWTIPEPAASAYTDTLMSNAKAFSDTAMIVITRVGGEGADLPTDMTAVVNGTWASDAQGAGYYAGSYDESLNEGADWDEGDHFLQLTNQEESMIKLVCENFEKVVLVYNGANAFELGFVKDYPQIKSVVLCPGTGQSGFRGFGRVISGAVNPSGRTVDTYVTSMKNAPWWNNFGSYKYTNMDEFKTTPTMFDPAGATPTFVNYVEGIYVGYKFYETAAAEGLINYEEEVVYPFGYGLSYTTFEQSMSDVSLKDGKLIFDVTVKNTGAVAGKDVVEVYVNPPYTNGGIEKASANLVDFAKTAELAAGASETISFTIPLENLAAYDDLGKGSYVLEAGDYILSINSDSHTVLDSRTYKQAEEIVYGEDNKRESDEIAAVNQFDFARGDATYLSRKDGFANYAQATAAPASYEMPAESKATFYNVSNYLTAEATAMDENPNAEAVKTGVATSLKLKDLRGLAADNPKWDELLDSMSLADFNALISLGGYQTAALESIEKVRTNDNDGPASINNNFTGVGSVGFPAATLIAATWSKQLAYSFGDSIGKMGNEMNTSGWYGPAMNIHRTAFAGRNFEYYSEDGVLSGFMAANAIAGSQSHGVYAYMKHFALNDQEGNRTAMLCTWSTEQAIREIYLKPFEMSVKEANCLAVMSSFNYVGNRWASGCAELCETVLRDEWGFEGFVETDYFGVYGYQSADQAIRNGTDLMLVNYPTETNDVRFTTTNGAQQAMRKAARRILYVVVNSRAYEEANYEKAVGTPAWKTMLSTGTIIAAALLAIWQILLLVNTFKKKKEEQ